MLRGGLAALGGLSAAPALLGARGARAMLSSAMTETAQSGQDAVTTATLDFGFRLLRQLAAPAANTIFSPSSVATALAMTYNGAQGSTQRAMAAALGLQGLSVARVNAAHALWRTALPRLDHRVQVSDADALWVRQNLTLLPQFLRDNQTYYGAEVAALDFASPQARTTINSWVSRQTHGKIASIIDHPIDPATALYLVNALYFKGSWTVRFNKADTRTGAFTLPGGQRKNVPMMSRTASFPYYRGQGFQAISLPYGVGRLSMYLFLPDSGSDLASFQRGLTAQTWTAWMAQFRAARGTIALPRFTVQYGANLNMALTALGMGEAFDPNRADFRGMVSGLAPSQNVFISEVAHKTYMQVDEEGTTAAASTSVGMTTAAMMPGFTMIVDRPFICAIRDALTGTLLFIGSIVDPT